MSKFIFLIIISNVFAGQIIEQAKQAYNRTQQFIQTSPKEEPLFKKKPEVLRSTRHSIKSTRNHSDHLMNYKELAFQMILDQLKELKETNKELEEIINYNSKTLELQADVNEIHKRRQDSIRFYVNIVAAIVGGIITIIGGIKGISAMKRR